MNDIKQINSTIEQLKKEVWYIAKVSIPDILKALGNLAMPNLDDIKADINENSDKITALESSVTGQASTINAMNAKLTSQETSITNINNELTTQDKRIDGCQSVANGNTAAINACLSSINAVDDRVMECEENLTSCQNAISTINPKVTTLESTVATHGTKLKTAESTLNTLSTNLTEVTNALNDTISLVGDLSEAMQGVRTTVSSHVNTLSTHDSQISALTTKVTNLETLFNEHQQSFTTWKNSVDSAIANLQNSGGQGGGTTLDLIYDNTSTDAAINRGFTAGLVGGNSFDFDFSSYKKVHVYAGLNKNDAYTVINLEKRRYAEGNLMAVSVGANRIMNMKVNITPAKNRFVVNQLAWFEANLTTGAISFTRDKGNVAYFVYRIEGEK